MRLRIDPLTVALVLGTALATGYTLFAAGTADDPSHWGQTIRPDYPAWYYTGK